MGYRAFFDEDRLFGIELEIVGVQEADILDALEAVKIRTDARLSVSPKLDVWRVHPDNSIRGLYPAEITSPILQGREGLEKVRLVVSTLSSIGCSVNRTCGYHVHWNCQDYTGKNMQSLLRLYTKFENVIDGLVSPSRRADINPHCRSMVKDDDLSWITELDPSGRCRAAEVMYSFSYKHQNMMPDLPLRGRASSRYHKVNIYSYQDYGTVEFRQHQGTVNSVKAINWLVFTQLLVSKAKQVTVSKQPSAKPTLGELLRVLRLPEHCLIEDGCTDPLILELGGWLKERHSQFQKEIAEEQ